MNGGKEMKLSLCSFEGHKIYMLITDNNIFIGLQVDNEPVVFPDVEEAKKFIKTFTADPGGISGEIGG